MFAFDPAAHGPAFASLLADLPLPPLGPGNPCRAVQVQLAMLTPDNAFAHTRLYDRDMSRACLAGLWLAYNFIDESHPISQTLDTLQQCDRCRNHHRQPRHHQYDIGGARRLSALWPLRRIQTLQRLTIFCRFFD